MPPPCPTGFPPADSSASPAVRVVAVVLASYAIVAGLITLLGWALDMPRLAAWTGHEIVIQPNTAVAGAVLGVGLLLLGGGLRRAAAAAGLIGGLIGAVTLVENITGIDAGIDRLLTFGRDWGYTGTASPGRMGVPAATSWTILGTGLMLAALSAGRGGWPRRAAALLAVLAAAVATLSIIGYLYGADPLYTLPRLSAIALPTATMVLAVAFGLAAMLPDQPPLQYLRDKGVAGTLARRALPLVLLVPVVVGWLRWLGQREQIYDPAFGTALRTLVEMFLLAGLLWWGVAKVRGRESLLREAVELSRGVIDGSEDCIKVLDLNGKFLDINARGRALTGLQTPAQWSGVAWADLWGPRYQGAAQEAVATAAAGGRGALTGSLTLQDGTTHWYEVAVTPLRGGSGKPERLLAVSRDVTERRAAEEAARAGERHLRALIDAIPAAVYTTDAEGRITYFNRAAEEFAGRRPALGERWCVTWKIEHPDGTPMPHDQCPMAIALREKRPVLGREAVAVRPDGSRVWFQPYPTPLFDERGELTGGVNMLVDVTERRQQALTSARLAAIVQSSDDAIVAKDLNGVVQSWNRGAERIFGYTAAEAVGRHITFIIPDDRLAEEDEVLGRIRRGESVDHFETKRRTKDGRLVDISLTVSPLRDAQGRVVGASKIARDVSARTRAEEALREHERALAARARVLEVLNRTGASLAEELDIQRLLQRVTDAATEVSNAKFGAFFYNTVNEQGEALLLYTLSGAPREAFERFGTPRNTGVFAPTFAGQGPVRSDDITKDPRYGHNSPHKGMPKGHLPVRSYLAVPVVSRSGTVIGGLFFGHPEPGVFTEEAEGIVVGIAAQAAVALDNARLYAEVGRSAARYRSIVEQSVAGVVEADPQGRLRSVNDRFCEIVGRRREELIGTSMSDLTHPDDLPACARMIEQTARTGEPFQIEKRYVRPNGATVWVHNSVSAVRDGDGSVQQLAAVVIDVTERREAEEALAAHRDRLEEMVAERSRQLEQSAERLRMTERMASLGTLSAGVGHDMGNLLIPLRMRIESLESQGLPDAAVEDLKAVRTCADYLQKLGSGLRSLAVDPGKGEARDAVELGAWWEEAGGVCRTVLPRSVTLEADLEVCPCWASISKPALTQAVFNLVQNAGELLRDRTHGRVGVRVREAGGMVELSVSDNGPGMTPEVRAHCLEPFFTTKPRGISTGLGLALVHTLVTEAGGSIEVRSEPGEGATFVLRLRPGTPPDAPGRHSLYAHLDVGDARLRAIVVQHLEGMNVGVLPQGTPAGEADLCVLDGPDAAPSGCEESGRPVVLLRNPGEAGPVPVRLLRERLSSAVVRARSLIGGTA